MKCACSPPFSIEMNEKVCLYLDPMCHWSTYDLIEHNCKED